MFRLPHRVLPPRDLDATWRGGWWLAAGRGDCHMVRSRTDLATYFNYDYLLNLS
jgi:hypothetical protein